jgi:hypothetical protein
MKGKLDLKMYFIINVLCAFIWHLSTFEYAGTKFHKQNSVFLGFYESGSRRLLRVSGVGLLYLFKLRTPNLSCGPKN